MRKPRRPIRPASPNAKLLRIRDVAERLSIGRASVYRLIELKVIDAFCPLGLNDLRITSDALDDYLEQSIASGMR